MLLGLFLLAASPVIAEPAPSGEAQAYNQKYEALPWIIAPSKPAVATRAAMTLETNVRFLDAKGTNTLLELTGNLPENDSYTLAPKQGGWFAVYSFNDIGFVKDDEKIDADALLKSLRDSQVTGNEQRKKQGLEPMTIAGWAVPPHYDAVTHNLEYGITLSTASGSNINYHLNMLGRRGVMDAALITSPETLKSDLAEFRSANKGFAYLADENYAAYKDGDKVSEYGLAALVTGGAAAALLKGGLLKGFLAGLVAFWKVIAVGAVAFFAVIRNFFARLAGRGKDLGPPPSE